MTPDEFEKQMKELQERYKYDFEVFHVEADQLMCYVLDKLGYGKGVEIFEGQGKYYA